MQGHGQPNLMKGAFRIQQESEAQISMLSFRGYAEMEMRTKVTYGQTGCALSAPVFDRSNMSGAECAATAGRLHG